VTRHDHDPARHADEASDELGNYLTARKGRINDRLAFAQVHALLAIAGQLAEFTAAVQVLATVDAAHPPVPEQAATPEQAAVIELSAPLWAGWQPGTWPVHDALDPRGWRWADPLEGT
jgi:hypothetical protein